MICTKWLFSCYFLWTHNSHLEPKLELVTIGLILADKSFTNRNCIKSTILYIYLKKTQLMNITIPSQMLMDFCHRPEMNMRIRTQPQISIKQHVRSRGKRCPTTVRYRRLDPRQNQWLNQPPFIANIDLNQLCRLTLENDDIALNEENRNGFAQTHLISYETKTTKLDHNCHSPTTTTTPTTKQTKL